MHTITFHCAISVKPRYDCRIYPDRLHVFLSPATCCSGAVLFWLRVSVCHRFLFAISRDRLYCIYIILDEFDYELHFHMNSAHISKLICRMVVRDNSRMTGRILTNFASPILFYVFRSWIYSANTNAIIWCLSRERLGGF
jgi:hypothetical protein